MKINKNFFNGISIVTTLFMNKSGLLENVSDCKEEQSNGFSTRFCKCVITQDDCISVELL